MATRDRADRLERLTNLVLVLLETPRPLSLREISDSVAGYPEPKEACRQAFERDKRELRSLGIPIESAALTSAEQVGYRIRPDDYYLADLGLDAAEEQALAFAVAAVQLTGGAGRDAVAKLAGAGDVPEPDLPPLAVLPSLPALAVLHEAVRARAVVRFTYHDRRREVEPFGLLCRHGAWYLVGRDRSVDGSELRTFRVDRLQDEPQLADRGGFELPEGFDLARAVRLAPWAESEAPAGEATATVVVDARLARRAAATVGPAAVRSFAPGGSVELAIALGDPDRLVDWVVGLGDTAEVVAPPSLRAETRRRLEALAGPDAPAPAAPGGPDGTHRPEPAAADGPAHRLPAPQPTAGFRLNRLLAILVHLSRVGEASLADLAQRFAMSEPALVRELELAACCGVPPYTPDQLIDLIVDEERVVADSLRELGSPRRLTPDEGFELAAAARALLAVPGADTDGALASALAKLSSALGASSLTVELDSPPLLAELRQAVDDREQLEIDYFGASATAPGRRVVDPLQVVVREGTWYLDAFCHEADGLRRFQVERVRAARRTGVEAAGVEALGPDDRARLSRPEAFLGASDATVVRLAVEPRARFAVEGVASGGLEELDDGRLLVQLPVSDADGWFGRLLLRLGPDAAVLGPEAFTGARRAAALRALARYAEEPQTIK